jgi:hypothetical protein
MKREQVLEQIKRTLHKDDYELGWADKEVVMITLLDLEIDHETEDWLVRPFSDVDAILEVFQFLTKACKKRTAYKGYGFKNYPEFHFDDFMVVIVNDWTV